MCIKKTASDIIGLSLGQKILKYARNNPVATEKLIAHTNFLPINASLKQRAIVTLNNTTSIPKCICKKTVTWNKKLLQFNRYCSVKCRSNDPEYKRKVKETLLSKYGVDNISNIPGAKQKKQETCMQNHGVPWPQQSQSVKNKTKQNNLKTYDVEYPRQHPSIKQKIENTNLKKYGSKSPFGCEEVQEKSKQTNLERYGVEYSLQAPEIREQIKQTNLERHGVEYPMMSKEIQQTRITNNTNKYGVEHPIQHTLPLELLNDFDWLYEHHITNQLSMLDMAKLLNVSDSTIKTYLFKNNITPVLHKANQDKKRVLTNLAKYDRIHYQQLHVSEHTLALLQNKEWIYDQHYVQQKPLTQIANELKCGDTMIGRYLHSHGLETQHFFQSSGEKEVCEFITSLNVKIKSNDRSIIHPYELDIYLPDYQLAIEYCGLYWHSEQHGRTKYYHKNKRDLCEQQGIQLLTLFEDEWIHHEQQVKNKILSLLNKNQDVVYARKTKIVQVSTKAKTQFFTDNHIQGSGPGSINIGLEYDRELIACMSFIKQATQHYLNRYATSQRVLGGFSKLLKHFQSNFVWTKIISFADLRWSDGDLYRRNGWVLDGVIPPDYSYSTGCFTRTHKFNYRRKNLPQKLKHFDPALSEWENCKANGILRIWDCGKMRFIIDNMK